MVRLTRREREVSELFKEGKTREDICKTMNISRVNLRDIVRRLRAKGHDPENQRKNLSEPEQSENEIGEPRLPELTDKLKLPETVADLIQYIQKANEIGQEIGKRLLDAWRKLGKLIEREIEAQPGVQSSWKRYDAWHESNKNLASIISRSQFYRAQVFAALPGLVENILEKTRPTDDFMEGTACTKIIGHLKGNGIYTSELLDSSLNIIREIKGEEKSLKKNRPLEKKDSIETIARKFGWEPRRVRQLVNNLLRYDLPEDVRKS